MQITTLQVSGFKNVIMGARGPYKSYDKSDTDFSQNDDASFVIGDADYSLLMRLTKAGRNHRKWARSVFVWADIIAPRYWWEEFATHRIGVEQNSESTIHTLYREEVNDDLFEFDVEDAPPCAVEAMRAAQNALRELQGSFKDADSVVSKNYYRRIMKQILPESFLQRRCVCMNYEALHHMYQERKNHRLPEWNTTFRDWVKTLPYSEFITQDKD